MTNHRGESVMKYQIIAVAVAGILGYQGMALAQTNNNLANNLQTSFSQQATSTLNLQNRIVVARNDQRSRNSRRYSRRAYWQNRYKAKRYKTKYRARSRSRRSYSFPSQRAGGKAFIFDPRKLAWAAYDHNGRLIKTGRASGGKGYCPDIRRSCRTPTGSFAVYRKGSAGCKSRTYPKPHGGARMAYCMFFTGGYAIHAGHVPNGHASHGCVRVQHSAARWLSKNFMSHGTKVIVRSY